MNLLNAELGAMGAARVQLKGLERDANASRSIYESFLFGPNRLKPTSSRNNLVRALSWQRHRYIRLFPTNRC